MVSNAVKEIFPNAKAIYHQRGEAPKGAAIKIVQGDGIFVLPLPGLVYRKMMQFDAGFQMGGLESAKEIRDTIEPFEFELTIPKRLIDLIGISQIYKALSESKVLELANTYETI